MEDRSFVKTRLMLEIESDLGRSIENLIIERRYGPRQMTCFEIAQDLDCSPGTVQHWSSLMGLTFRSVAIQAMRERVEISGSSDVKRLRKNA
jgi:hypothetical protein